MTKLVTPQPWELTSNSPLFVSVWQSWLPHSYENWHQTVHCSSVYDKAGYPTAMRTDRIAFFYFFLCIKQRETETGYDVTSYGRDVEGSLILGVWLDMTELWLRWPWWMWAIGDKWVIWKNNYICALFHQYCPSSSHKSNCSGSLMTLQSVKHKCLRLLFLMVMIINDDNKWW